MNHSFPTIRFFATVLFLFLQFSLHAQTSADRERIHLGLEFGKFNYTWYAPSSRLQNIERLPSDRYHVALRADRHIKDNFGVSLSLFYADYHSRGKTHAEAYQLLHFDRDTTGYIHIEETFIGPEVGVTYRIPIPVIAGRLSFAAGFRYGLLVRDRTYGTIVRAYSCNPDAEGNPYRCDLRSYEYDPHKSIPGTTTFTKSGNNFTLYSSLGLEIGSGKIKPYVELRGYLGQLGVLDQAYGYNEYGLVGGVRF